VNKQDLVEIVAREADLSKASAGRAVDAALRAVVAALRRGDAVGLVGFGTFTMGRRGARAGRNPRTGEPIAIGEARVPRFRAGKALRDALN